MARPDEQSSRESDCASRTTQTAGCAGLSSSPVRPAVCVVLLAQSDSREDCSSGRAIADQRLVMLPEQVFDAGEHAPLSEAVLSKQVDERVAAVRKRCWRRRARIILIDLAPHIVDARTD